MLGIVGVLDWELAHLGDPARDLGYLLLNSWRFGVNERDVGGMGHLDELVTAYEAESGRELEMERVRWWQTAGSYWWGVTCLVQGSRFHAGADGPLGGVEYPAIARRVSEAEADCANLIIPGAGDQLPEVHPSDPPGSVVDLMTGLSAFLKNELEVADGDRFLVRVGANSADIVARDARYGSAVREIEFRTLRTLTGMDEATSLDDLRRAFGEQLWTGSRSMTDPIVARHLRTTASHQLAIDQPRYIAPPLWPGNPLWQGKPLRPGNHSGLEQKGAVDAG